MSVQLKPNVCGPSTSRSFDSTVRGLITSKHRKERISAIAEFLASSNHLDVVCLQEVWTRRDFYFLRDKVSSKLPYTHYFYSGVVGSGNCILSKHPIQETFFHQWSVNGYIHRIHHGDWWGGKGAGLCRLEVQHGTNTYYVNVFTAHLHAEYNRVSDDYLAHRVLQAFDTAQFIMLTSGAADLTILAGDLNTEPGDLAYRVLLTIPNMTDAYIQADITCMEIHGTNECYKNSFTPYSSIKENSLGKRIDYVMYHHGSNIDINLKNYSLPLPNRIPKKSYSYSDHEGVQVELTIKKCVEASDDLCENTTKKQVLEECIAVCNAALKRLNKTKVFYWLGLFVLFLLLIASIIAPVVININKIRFFHNYPSIISIVRIILTTLMIFCFLMATLWHRIEMHGILAGKLGMEISLRKLEHCKNL